MSGPSGSEETSIRLERRIDAGRETVFDAWLQAEVLKLWWPAGSDWETPVAEVDPRVGGRLRLVMRSPEGEEFGGRGTYIQIEPPERLAYRWTWDGHEGHRGTTLIEVEFLDAGDETTTVVLTVSGLEDEQARRLQRNGWEAALDNLQRVLEE